MEITYEMIRKAAAAEAKFDKVDLDTLARWNRERYEARAALGLIAALGLVEKTYGGAP